MIQLILIPLLILLIAMSGILSASETALFSLSPMKVRALKDREERGAKMAATLLSQPRKLLVTILMLNVGMNILVQNVVSSIFGTLSGWLVTVGVPLVLTLLFGEIIPKSIAITKNTQIAIAVSPFIRFIEKAIKPLRNLFVTLGAFVSRFSFFFLKKSGEISTSELKHALRTSKKVGALNSDEAKLIRGYLNLEEDVIKEIMCPRLEVIYFDIDEPISKLVHLFAHEELGRIPVCNGSLEEVLGIISSTTFFLHRDKIQEARDLIPYLKKPSYVPESILGKTLLKKFYQEQETLVLAVDEYGSTSGIVTLEDLVEVVIGQISDRRDEKRLYTQASDSIIIASGKLELSEFEEIFDVHLESPNNMATIGGWLTEQMGDIPKSGAKHVTDEFLFHVLSADSSRVRRVYIRRLKGAK